MWGPESQGVEEEEEEEGVPGGPGKSVILR